MARGDYNEKSDIDFLINIDAIKETKGFPYYLGDLELLHEAPEKLLGRKVDVVENQNIILARIQPSSQDPKTFDFRRRRRCPRRKLQDFRYRKS